VGCGGQTLSMQSVQPPIFPDIYMHIVPPCFFLPTHPWSGVAVDMLPSLVVADVAAAAAGIKLVVGIGGGS